VSSLRRRAEFGPPLLLGAACAMAAEVAIGVLLYAGTGLMRSLSTVLVVEAAAFAVGLWSAPGPGPRLPSRIRRRWLLCMMSFLAAAFYGTSWSVLRELGETALGQGFGLAIMAALPLYTCGAVLGGMSAARLTDGRGPRVGPGAAATTGAAIGFLITGFMLPRAPVPSHLLIVCLLLLSVGGVWYRVLLGSHLHIDVKASESSAISRVRVEDRRLLADRVASRILLEGEHVRRTARLSGENEVVPWDIAVARGLMPLLGVPWRVLVVGGGVSPLPRMVVREHPIASVEVLERVGAVVEFGRDHFDTGLHVGHTERSSVAVGNLDDLVEGLSGSYDLVVVDSAALEALGGREGLSRRSRAILRQRISADGVLVWGPDADPAQDAVTGWSTLALARAGEGGEEEVVLVAGPEAALASIDVIEGFRVLNGGAAIT
jgi:hypothetical protein